MVRRRNRDGPTDWGASETHSWGEQSRSDRTTHATDEGARRRPQGTQVPEGWVELYDSLAPSQAALFGQILADQGVAVVRRDSPSGSILGLGNIPEQLLVKAEDEARALAVLEEWSEAKPEFPADLADE